LEKVVQTFVRRITDPSKGPLTFDEARDYYSNISRLSANEFSRLNPIVQREVGVMRHTLQKALTDAASMVGKADEYARGMTEYARAAKAQKTFSDLKPSIGTIAKRVGEGAGLGAGGSMIWS
jgi:hypothetical protein